jgi:hypothetical protein
MFSVVKLEIWTIGAVGLILVLTYLGLLVHILRGNQKKWLIAVTVMLMVSSFGSIMVSYALVEIMLKKQPTTIVVIILGAGVGVKYGMFTVSHLMLAEKYQQMSKRVPCVLLGLQETPQSDCSRWTGKILMALNVIAPIAQGTSCYFLRETQFVEKQKPPQWLPLFVTSSYAFVGMLLVVSGIILIKSVIKIRSFFKAQNASEYIDVPMLIRHSVSFGLYLVTIVCFFTVFSIYSFFPNANM